MTDIFQEIDEDLRRERAGKLWRKYGKYVIGLAVLIVVIVAGWRALEWYRQQQAEAAGGRFQDALALARAGKPEDAEKAFAALAPEAPLGYQILSRFRAAAEAGKRDPAIGVKAFQELAADAGIGPLLQSLARIRGGYLQVDSAAYADLAKTFEPMTAAADPMRHSAREILGLAAWKAKDLTNASKWFEAVLGDKDVPNGARQRAEVMLQLIAADAPAKAAS